MVAGGTGMVAVRADKETGVDEDGAADKVGWAVFQDAPALLEDFPGLKYAFAAKTANVEVLEPHTLTKAKCRPDWPLWEKATEEELATLKAAGTWRLEEAPLGANIIGSKWVFKAKKDAVGNVIHYKARLVAQGFSQIGGIDYDDTYTPVACLTSSCMIIAMANRLDLELHQVDIKGAYLNGVLNNNEVLYMQHPPGYKAQGIGHLMTWWTIGTLLLTNFLTIYVHFSHTSAGVITTSFILSYLLSNPLQPHPIVCASLQIITKVLTLIC